ncbi:MAG: oligoendopeptidase F, partial [Clostridia bacterium]|nr:oligoendopeptidase F [Clostridia bacterium]
MALKTHAEMDPRFTWDLSPIFENDGVWEQAFEAVKAEMPSLQSIPGTLGASADSLKKGLDAINALGEKLERVAQYSFLRSATDNG